MTIPTFATRREVSLSGETFTAALAISEADVSALWAVAGESWTQATLASLNAVTAPDQPVVVYRSEAGRVSLWLGPTMLAELQR